jgi:hypothetical protein
MEGKRDVSERPLVDGAEKRRGEKGRYVKRQRDCATTSYTSPRGREEAGPFKNVHERSKRTP